MKNKIREIEFTNFNRYFHYFPKKIGSTVTGIHFKMFEIEKAYRHFWNPLFVGETSFTTLVNVMSPH